jgi:hypothetical protein
MTGGDVVKTHTRAWGTKMQTSIFIYSGQGVDLHLPPLTTVKSAECNHWLILSAAQVPFIRD